jgi:hypothetical protein
MTKLGKRSADEALFEEESGQEENARYLEMAAKSMPPGLLALQEKARQQIAARAESSDADEETT